ncbi:MAG: hypothetical protein R3286_20440, partial [Gammaproteobacteria bacterium]|nr:hypothetical protein [Gammaproteobacteria bacterium]
GSAQVIEWLARLERGDLEDAGDVIAGLRDHRAAFLAVPILIEQASDIDHPAFGLANYWLGKLGRLPENQWGAEFFGDKYAEANETLVPKLLARADGGRLFVSYRAHFTTGEPFRRARIVSRTVLIELTEVTQRVKYSIELDAHPGWNRANGVEAFFNLLPGSYTLEIHPRTRYSTGVFTSGSRSARPLHLVLVDSPY